MALRLRRIVAVQKVNIEVGKWQSGKVPKASFPMGKAPYGLGNSYRWCVVTFTAFGAPCRVLVVLNLAKEKFEAILGVGDDVMRILCAYEYHAGEPGWHCHAACEDLSAVPLGYRRGPWVRRLPAAKQAHSRLDFGIKDEIGALHFAFDAYNIDTRDTPLSQGELL